MARFFLLIFFLLSNIFACEFSINPKYLQSPIQNILLDYANFLNFTCKKDFDEKLLHVNSYLNKINQKHDANTYASDEHWANILEFFQNKGGDCEDFSLAKLYTLSLLQIPSQDLFLAACKDLFSDTDHMVLVVKKENNFFVLDNLSFKVLPIQKRSDLKIMFLINENKFYKYDYKRNTIIQIPAKNLPSYRKFQKNRIEDLVLNKQK